MSNNSVQNLIYLIENGNNKEIQNCINNLKGRVTLQEYNSIIDAVFKKLNIDKKPQVRQLFNQKLQFNIKTYKEILNLEASKRFNKLKDQKESVFVSFSKNICDSLAKMEVEEVLIKYSHEIEFIKEIKMYSQFIHLIRECRDAQISKDNQKIFERRSDIREFFRIFNLKYKNKFIKEYCNKRLEEIYDDFEIKPKYADDKILLSKESFTTITLQDNRITNNLKSFISTHFQTELENNDLKKLIMNILNNKDIDNYKLLNIYKVLEEINEKITIIDEQRTFNRLVRNYQDELNSLFKNDDKQIVIDILKSGEIKKYRPVLKKAQFILINYLLILYKEANCNIELKDNKVEFVKQNKISNTEYQSLKEDLYCFKMYQRLKNIILNLYYNESENRKQIIENKNLIIGDDVQFDDDNYQLKNNTSLLNYDLLIDILSKLDYKKINNYNEEQINFLKRILYKEGLLGCIMKYPSCINISNVINGINYCDWISNKNIDIEKIIKLTSIYSVADDFSISVLGSDVVKKIVCNAQFLQTNSKEEKKERIKKALQTNILALTKPTSSIPYNINTSFDDVKISRYNNDNPNIFKSGIDTGTCFKLDGDDNDFVIYTILNQNGGVFKIEYQGEFIGRISAFRNCKVLYLNSVRIKNEREEKISKEVNDRNKKIYNCLVELAKKIIITAYDNNDEIDFVVCNKAGILESNIFNNQWYIIPEHIVKQPLDIYNKDWKEFINLPENLLKQANRGEQVPFTTDYGHYPALLVASKNNNLLERLSDVGYNQPSAIYERPKTSLKLYTNNFKEALEKIYRIDALKFYEEIGDIEKCQLLYQRPNINLKQIDKISLNDYYYKIDFIDGTSREVKLSINENNKVLTKK